MAQNGPVPLVYAMHLEEYHMMVVLMPHNSSWVVQFANSDCLVDFWKNDALCVNGMYTGDMLPLFQGNVEWDGYYALVRFSSPPLV